MVGGNPQQLAPERSLGVESTAIAFKPSYINYPSDEILARPGDGLLRLELRRIELLSRAMRQFDLIHFNFGQTITPLHSWDAHRIPDCRARSPISMICIPGSPVSANCPG